MNQTEFLKNKKIDTKFSFIGKINSINKGENFINVDLLLVENFSVNIKLNFDFDVPHKEKIYFFETKYIAKKEKKILICEKYKLIEDILDWQKIYYYYKIFFKCSDISFEEIDKQINKILDKIKNPILKEITNNLYQKNKKNFLISPAACKMHHNFYGGLGQHTYNMLRMSNYYSQIYPFINKDLLNCGIILHDIAKIKEFDFISKTYKIEGVLLGHLILGVNIIHEESNRLGYNDKEEVLILKHLLISHHGLLQYGSFKEPLITEALLLWHLDDIDSKLNTLQENLEKTEKGKFTDKLNSIKCKQFYKPNL
ncbi:MAG: HD domain-containing protein [Candidatus Phytoplasma stylosanthis]|uniref:HD domain-containing protein n=1 Tax=Candidatus Phytoplasma stylosanthis TaxID=2798314 RepID=UPI00293A62CC|nr:HD domain-containing protein [Candidatus Phytoplasma stylosanthis]MDV3167876.1 HD domain-containing protein [Candidatus Phytoplasma stylosanthis]MDV3170848.1 HD domain-containing protein [Candidatus Phytoplasma stylosanthis]MDV3173526.1 HD domain-containing protein [Candidatus Phytoplasma stylosanthis]MDV3174028.1 HD domain-containing protein [Candidatus Phytoplasma stylosanthis]MDV3202460.1 HD domain-containing protein [Candidatus Phytoplasma stylosanthis]